MRSVQAKGLRRDIRRAMGPQALSTLDSQGSAILSVRHDVNDLAADYAEFKQETRNKFARQFERLDTERGTNAEAVAMNTAAHVGFVARGFWARFSWLLLGE